MSIATLKNRAGFRGISFLLLTVATLQGCASGAATAPRQPAPSGSGAAGGGRVACTTPEYQDLLRKSQELPLTDAEQKRMDELYRDCVARANGQEVKGGSALGSFFKVIPYLGLIGGLAWAAVQYDSGALGAAAPIGSAPAGGGAGGLVLSG